MTKAESKIETVTMLNGEVVDFPGTRKLLKSSFLTDDGKVGVKLQFRNGEARSFVIPDSLLLKFAAHGAEQKFGDEIAGIADLDDAVTAVDNLNDRIQAGNWGVERVAGAGTSGASILAKALAELTGKPVDAIRKTLAEKTQVEKVALRNSARLKPIVERLEAEKAAKSNKKGTAVDSDSLLAEFDTAE